MQYKIAPLFSSPVIQVIIQEDTDELKQNKDFGYNNNQQEMKDYTESNGRILERYVKSKTILLNTFKIVAEQVLKYSPREYQITTSWATIIRKGESSQSHNHHNSFWSGVYYYGNDYPEGCAPIGFKNPNTNMSSFALFGRDLQEFNEYNAKTCEFAPQSKLLLLFPSYLEHRILTHNHDSIRYSLAFNIVPLGSWGEGDSSYNMSWVN